MDYPAAPLVEVESLLPDRGRAHTCGQNGELKARRRVSLTETPGLLLFD